MKTFYFATLAVSMAFAANGAAIVLPRGGPKVPGNVHISLSTTSGEVPGTSGGNQPVGDQTDFAVVLPDGKKLTAQDAQCHDTPFGNGPAGSTCTFNDPQLKVPLDVFYIVTNAKIGQETMKIDYNGKHIESTLGGGGQKDKLADECTKDKNNAPFKANTVMTCDVQTP